MILSKRGLYTIARAFVVCAGIAIQSNAPVDAAEIDLVGPPGSNGFGWAVTVLPNGNIVVVDPFAGVDGLENVGAIYLYSPTGTLISTLRGSSADDTVGYGPLFVLADGNFVVTSPSWHNGDARSAGAATWIDATTGLDGTIGAENSLVGSSADDQVGMDVTVLANGSYVVSSPKWSNGEVAEVGAATFVPAGGGVHGAVSSANSLVGTTAYDRVGQQAFALANGNYLVASPNWQNGALPGAGAITWASGSTGIAGAISAQNSLVGGSAGDNLGFSGVFGSIHRFPNGNAVVGSPAWDNGDVADAGAVTWIDGAHGIAGLVSAANSLVGAASGDSVGADNGSLFTELPGGRYAILSSAWSNTNGDHVGAVTWADSSSAITGTITPANSLTGGTSGDFDVSRVIPLTNGNWVVSARNWTNGSAKWAGAVTWIDGAHPLTGPISTANSLVGTTQNAGIGWWVTPLANGNYVVASPGWSNGSAGAAGAATWVDGSAPRTGTVTPENSLVGSHAQDFVGMGQDGFGSGGVVALANGNYVVLSSNWSTDAAEHVGAATWGNGATGTTGAIGAQNSLIGDTAGDNVGLFATPLANGNVVISSPNWHTWVGAVTWLDGATGFAGTLSQANSLVGRAVGDNVASVTPVASGNYFVSGKEWSYSDAAAEAGAVAWGNGRVPLIGEVSQDTALVGTHYLEWVGFSVQAAGNDSVVITSEDSVILARGGAPLSGNPNADHGVLAQQPGQGIPSVAYDAKHDRLVVGWYRSNYVAIFQTEALLQNGFD